jgi:hypothetical protein
MNLGPDALGEVVAGMTPIVVPTALRAVTSLQFQRQLGLLRGEAAEAVGPANSFQKRSS